MKSGAFAAASFMYWWRSVCAQLASELHPEVVPAAPAKYDLEMFEGARYVALGCDLADEVREIRDHAMGMPPVADSDDVNGPFRRDVNKVGA